MPDTRVYILLARETDGTVRVGHAISQHEMDAKPESWAEALEAAEEELTQGREGKNTLASAAFGVVTVEVPEESLTRAFTRWGALLDR